MDTEFAESLFVQLFGSLLDVNGRLAVGLAAAVEAQVPKSLRIPVPARSIVLQSATPDARVRIAHWAYQKSVEEISTTSSGSYSQVFAMGAYLAWLTGSVAALGPMPTSLSYEQAVGLNWDCEVNVFNEAVPDIDKPLSIEEHETMSHAEEMNNLGRIIINYVVSAKLTWWATGHHLGSESLGGQRVRQGYLSKIVANQQLMGFSFNSDAEKNRLYSLIHPWSTLKVMGAISENSAIRKVISLPVNFHRSACISAPCVNIQASADVMQRVNSFGAGYALVGDLVTALKSLAPTPLVLNCPGIKEVSSLVAVYNEVKASVYKYGIGARYLTGSDHLDRVDTSTFQTLRTSLICFVRAVKNNTTLGRAACFDSKVDVSVMDGYSASFDAACVAFAEQMAGADTVDVKKLRFIMQSSYHLSGEAPGPEILEALKAVGFSASQNYYEKMARAGKEYDRSQGRSSSVSGDEAVTRPSTPAPGPSQRTRATRGRRAPPE